MRILTKIPDGEWWNKMLENLNFGGMQNRRWKGLAHVFYKFIVMVSLPTTFTPYLIQLLVEAWWMIVDVWRAEPGAHLPRSANNIYCLLWLVNCGLQIIIECAIKNQRWECFNSKPTLYWTFNIICSEVHGRIFASSYAKIP